MVSCVGTEYIQFSSPLPLENKVGMKQTGRTEHAEYTTMSAAASMEGIGRATNVDAVSSTMLHLNLAWEVLYQYA
jgi:hypothetical protein